MDRIVYVKNNVVKGFGRGKELQCPTANVGTSPDIPTGIYCGLVQLVIKSKDEIQMESNFQDTYNKIVNDLPYISPIKGMVLSFGYNPQYGNKDRSLEVHILDDIEFNFYNAELRVLICKKMRNEEKYNSIDELKDAIANDIKNATKEIPNFICHASNKDYFIEINNNGDTTDSLGKCN